MDLIDPSVIASADGLWKQVLEFIVSLTQPYRLWQVAIVLALGVLAHFVGKALAARLDTWMRDHRGLTVRQVRAGVLLRRRLRGILFALLAWAAVLVISEISPYPSRRYLVELVATIATALVLIGLVTRVIRNRFLRRMVSWAGWIYVTLLYLGFLDNFTGFLDSIAITFADFRLSALTVIKALIVTGALVTGARLLTQGAASRIRRNDDISPSVQVLAVKLMQVTAYGAAVFIGLKAVGFDLTGLAVLSGAIGVGLGFGLQKVVSNLVSGVIILLDKSVKPGDVISLGETFGWIGVAWCALCLGRHPRRQGIPDPERRPDHRPGGQLVAFQRIRPHRPDVRQRLPRRSAPGAQTGHRGRPCHRPGAEGPPRRLPHHRLWRQFGRLCAAVLDP